MDQEINTTNISPCQIGFNPYNINLSYDTDEQKAFRILNPKKDQLKQLTQNSYDTKIQAVMIIITNFDFPKAYSS